jgi:hypothetical protein
MKRCLFRRFWLLWLSYLKAWAVLLHDDMARTSCCTATANRNSQLATLQVAPAFAQPAPSDVID